jgi:RNA polymerase sigma-70 factor (ECF subfamily)
MTHEFGADEIGALRPRLLSRAMRKLGDRARAEDAVQEALLAAIEGLDGFSKRSSAETWVFAILGHKIVDGIRGSGRMQPLPDDGADVESAAPGPADEAGLSQLLQALESGLACMPARQARAFVLLSVLGLDTDEACADLSMSRSHLWVSLHRARKRLRAYAPVGAFAPRPAAG